MAAYQANYGFSEDGDQGANSAAVSGNDPGASESSKQKSGDAAKNPNPDPHETSAKEVKQKAEKRKADPGKVTATTTED